MEPRGDGTRAAPPRQRLRVAIASAFWAIAPHVFGNARPDLGGALADAGFGHA